MLIVSWLKTRLVQLVRIARGRVAIDALLYAFSLYLVPTAILVMSVLAFAQWENLHPSRDGDVISYSVIEDASNALSTEGALARLASQPYVANLDTGRSENPFWFSFKTPEGRGQVIEMPSRHTQSIDCWDAKNMAPIGHANHATTSGALSPSKAGFALTLSDLAPSNPVLCRAYFAGPARLTVNTWPAAHLLGSNEKYTFDGGVIEGGLLTLAFLVAVTAFANREWLYLVFAAWLVGNLRLAALSTGFDTQWLGYAVPLDWILPMRKLTIAIYYTLTITLFSRLLRVELRKAGYATLLRLDQWSCLPLVLMAVFLPFKYFLPWMWVFAGFTIGVFIFLLARIWMYARSTVALWYTISLNIMLLSTLFEIVAAAFGAKVLLGFGNSVVAALFSSLMAAMAIAEQIRQERKARIKAQSDLDEAYKAIPIGLFTLSSEGVFLRGNPALSDILGIKGNPKLHWEDYFERGSWKRLNGLIEKSNDEMEVRGRNKESPRWFLVKATGSGDRIEGSLQDVTQKVEATSRLQFLAENDQLTGTLNRHGLMRSLYSAINEKEIYTPLCIAYLDLDRFKLINDLFGHTAGDEVLKQVCGRIKDRLSFGHDVGRVGGDEFILVLRDISIQTAAFICRDIIRDIGEQPYFIGDKSFQIRGSIGLIEAERGASLVDIVSVADRACQEAKKHPHRLVVHGLNDSVYAEHDLEHRLVKQFGSGEVPSGLFLVMQPIMSMNMPLESLNFEVLLRMRDTDGQILPAGKIITAAERNGQTSIIDRWVISSTLQWITANQHVLNKTHFVCVNLSAGSINDEKFIGDIFSYLEQYKKAAQMICVEITESVAIHDHESTRRFIAGIRKHGAKVALDDFGAGYTSFSYLKELPADIVKIDGSFVKDMNAHSGNLAIIQSIVDLVRNLGMRSVAEWAEDHATVETLALMGVDYVQGYAIAHPQMPEAILAAQSSAGFIQDEKIIRLVHELQATGGILAGAGSLFGAQGRLH